MSQPSRDERRQRTGAAILAAAREPVAEVGLERTTIRGVAGRARVDPALVVQRYGDEEARFAAAARWDEQRVLSAPLEPVPEAALDDCPRASRTRTRATRWSPSCAPASPTPAPARSCATR